MTKKAVVQIALASLAKKSFLMSNAFFVMYLEKV
jgi:hypothetical protein